MSREKTGQPRKVGFSGKLTFAKAEVLRGKMVKALESERVEIYFGEVKEVDLSFLQLLCAALRTAAGGSRMITVARGAVPEALSELVETAGMVSPLGRGEDSFWGRLAGRNGSGASHG
jgi:ABC-type transporter Mla MlaB component